MPKPRRPQTAAEKRKRVQRTKRVRRVLLTVALLVACVGGYLWFTHRPVMPLTPIYQGVSYGCIEMPESEEASGRVHLVVVDMATPGVEFFFTPVSGTAAMEGYDYKLRMASGVAREDQLAVLINGTHFAANSWFIPLPGDMADIRETVVTHNQISRGEVMNYLFWIDATNTPRIDNKSPPPKSSLDQAVWGIGSRDLMISDGKLPPLSASSPTTRTLLGVNTQTKRLYLAVFENTSYRAASTFLLNQGARDAVALSGGYSSVMVLGDDTRNTRPGAVLGGWRPLATFVGIKAAPLPK